MTDLLAHEEYRALAAALDLPQNAWIDGGYRPAISGKTFDTVNPATGAVLGTVAACAAADVDLAVQKAREAFEDGRWSHLHPGARKEVLVRLAKLMLGTAGFSAANPAGREAIASVYVALADITAINGAMNEGKTMEAAVADWTAAHADLLGRWTAIKTQ